MNGQDVVDGISHLGDGFLVGERRFGGKVVEKFGGFVVFENVWSVVGLGDEFFANRRGSRGE